MTDRDFPWCCPLCHGTLLGTSSGARCAPCARDYPAYNGIYDFRVSGAAWIELDADRAFALDLLTDPDAKAEALTRRVFSARAHVSPERAAEQTRSTLGLADHLRVDVAGWLAPVFAQRGDVLDLGCGPGGLITASLAAGHTVMGIDVSLTWLVVAHALIREHGGTPMLAAGFGEALPLRDGSVTGVLSLDVIEHVAGRSSYMSEIDRVLAGGGCLALSTPNRFSLAAEPHVGVWGVGWLPRRWQRRFAEWRSGVPYGSTWLLSWFELERTVARGGALRVSITAPQVPEPSIERFSTRRAMLARLYNRIVSIPVFQQVALCFGPFFRVIAVKRS